MPQDVYIYNPDSPVPKDARHVEIPEGITVIGKDAFLGCSDLQSVTIPNSVTKIGEFAFAGCIGLQSVTIPDGITKIGNSAFNGCSALQSVTIPDSITKIGISTFSGCSALQSIAIPDNVTEIKDGAFWNCSALQSVTIPDGVTEISFCTFKDCFGLQAVKIPDGVTKIDSQAFYNCSALQSVIMPDSIIAIGDGAFCKCSRLQSVTVPDGVTGISYNAFYGCSGLRSITIPDSVTKIDEGAFCDCSSLQSITIPDSTTEIGASAFWGCPALQSLIYKGINIAPFIRIDGHGVNTFDVIKALIEHRIPLSENIIRQGIDAAHQNRLARWTQEYPVFGEMRLPAAVKQVSGREKERLQKCFAGQKRTGGHIPRILNELAITVRACDIPPERIAETFDVKYTGDLINRKDPLVPATACRCYYGRDICDMLIRKNKTSVMAEAIGLYNKSGRQECYKHLMDFIISHADTRTEDLLYAADNAAKIPMRADTTPAQIRQHRTYTENLAEVTKIEAKYGQTVSGFKLSDYPCSIEPVSIAYDGMTARVLDLSDEKDIALAAGLGELTDCCQSLGKAGETAMMHGFLNPDAGFWVIEGKDGKIKAQAEIWEAGKGVLVFDNIEFADTDREHLSDRAEQLRGVIAAWAMKSGYRNIIMGCGYNELGVGLMEQAPIPELRLTPEEVFALQRTNSMWASFRNVDAARQYMQTDKYNPGDFVYTDANERCVYIKKDGIVSDYLIEGYDRTLAEDRCAQEHKTAGDRSGGILCL